MDSSILPADATEDRNVSEPLVSVIIPTRDRAALLQRAVDSVLAQSIRDLELIVVDDGSRDGTAELVRAIQDDRLHLERISTPSGGGAARNIGISVATGKYIALLDSDDQWHPEKLAKQLEILQGEIDCPVVCYSQVWQITDAWCRVIPERGISEGQDVASYFFEAGGIMQTSSLLLPRWLARQVAFDPALPRHQDYDFCLRLEAAGACFRFVEQPLVHWYVDRGRNRVSESMDFDASFRWLDSVGSAWSAKTRVGFLVKEVMSRYLETDSRRLYVAWLALRGLWHGMVNPNLAMRLAARAPFPGPIRQRAKRAFRHVSGR